MREKIRALWRARAASVSLALAVVLGACGGGGDGGGGASSAVAPSGGGPTQVAEADRNGFPFAVENIYPDGQRVDVAALDLFPVAAGAEWVYDRTESNGSVATGALVSRVIAGPFANRRVSIADIEDGGVPLIQEYVVDAEGVIALHPFTGIAPATASNLIGSLLLYPTPLYPLNGERRHLRSGQWGEDIDGDGRQETFRFVFTSVFLGFESVTVAGVTLANVAKFREVTTLELRGSRPPNTIAASTVTTENWYAPGLGLVKRVQREDSSDPAASRAPVTYTLARATIGTRSWPR